MHSFSGHLSYWFQHNVLTLIENGYVKTLKFALNGYRPIIFFLGTVGIFIFTMMLFGNSGTQTLLFPDAEPKIVYIYAEAPLGTDVEVMDATARQIENKVREVLTPHASAVNNVLINIGRGTSDPQASMGAGAGNVTPHKARVTVDFVDFQYRKDLSTNALLTEMGDAVREIPGLKVTTGKQGMGPPVGAAVNIEVTGDNYITLIEEAERMKTVIEQSGVKGLDNLKLDLETGKPELLVNIDRETARTFGLSTGMLAMNLRTAIYGKEVGKLKVGEDDYPIQLRLEDKFRYDISAINEQQITYRDNKGRYHQIPISAVADLEYSSTYGSVKRKDMERMISLTSGVKDGYNANEVVEKIKNVLQRHELPEGYQFKFTGEQEEQAESMIFLVKALLIAICGIFLILVSQFNSAVKPFIIMLSVLFSLIGVLLGIMFFGDDFVIIMTGIGIISLAGVVVNNAIVLIDYTDLVRERKRIELGLGPDEHLPKAEFIECLMQAGFTRLRPVLLTAITTILGLIPLATGFNIDFFGLFAHFEPEIYWGGENADFWGPMAWTVVYGLFFSTFLTLVIIPVMYLLSDVLIAKVKSLQKKEEAPEVEENIAVLQEV